MTLVGQLQLVPRCDAAAGVQLVTIPQFTAPRGPVCIASGCAARVSAQIRFHRSLNARGPSRAGSQLRGAPQVDAIRTWPHPIRCIGMQSTAWPRSGRRWRSAAPQQPTCSALPGGGATRSLNTSTQQACLRRRTIRRRAPASRHGPCLPHILPAWCRCGSTRPAMSCSLAIRCLPRQRSDIARRI